MMKHAKLPAVAAENISAGQMCVAETDERGYLWIRPATAQEIQDMIVNSREGGTTLD